MFVGLFWEGPHLCRRDECVDRLARPWAMDRTSKQSTTTVHIRGRSYFTLRMPSCMWPWHLEPYGPWLTGKSSLPSWCTLNECSRVKLKWCTCLISTFCRSTLWASCKGAVEFAWSLVSTGTILEILWWVCFHWGSPLTVHSQQKIGV